LSHGGADEQHAESRPGKLNLVLSKLNQQYTEGGQPQRTTTVRLTVCSLTAACQELSCSRAKVSNFDALSKPAMCCL
jgi:hypothetical protein